MALPLTVPHHPHPQPRRLRSGGIRHGPCIEQPGRPPHHRYKSRPIERSELRPFGEHQQGIGATGRLIGIGHQVPAAHTAARRLAGIIRKVALPAAAPWERLCSRIEQFQRTATCPEKLAGHNLAIVKRLRNLAPAADSQNRYPSAPP